MYNMYSSSYLESCDQEPNHQGITRTAAGATPGVAPPVAAPRTIPVQSLSLGESIGEQANGKSSEPGVSEKNSSTKKLRVITGVPHHGPLAPQDFALYVEMALSTGTAEHCTIRRAKTAPARRLYSSCELTTEARTARKARKPPTSTEQPVLASRPARRSRFIEHIDRSDMPEEAIGGPGAGYQSVVSPPCAQLWKCPQEATSSSPEDDMPPLTRVSRRASREGDLVSDDMITSHSSGSLKVATCKRAKRGQDMSSCRRLRRVPSAIRQFLTSKP